MELRQVNLTHVLTQLHDAGAKSVTTALMLLLLKEHGDLRLSRLAEHAHVTLSNISVLVKRLESLGWVRAYKPDEDRREVRVKLTREGLELLNNALQANE